MSFDLTAAQAEYKAAIDALQAPLASYRALNDAFNNTNFNYNQKLASGQPLTDAELTNLQGLGSTRNAALNALDPYQKRIINAGFAIGNGLYPDLNSPERATLIDQLIHPATSIVNLGDFGAALQSLGNALSGLNTSQRTAVATTQTVISQVVTPLVAQAQSLPPLIVAAQAASNGGGAMAATEAGFATLINNGASAVYGAAAQTFGNIIEAPFTGSAHNANAQAVTNVILTGFVIWTGYTVLMPLITNGVPVSAQIATWTDGTVMTDGAGNALLLNADGTFVVDAASGNFIVCDAVGTTFVSATAANVGTVAAAGKAAASGFQAASGAGSSSTSGAVASTATGVASTVANSTASVAGTAVGAAVATKVPGIVQGIIDSVLGTTPTAPSKAPVTSSSPLTALLVLGILGVLIYNY